MGGGGYPPKKHNYEHKGGWGVPPPLKMNRFTFYGFDQVLRILAIPVLHHFGLNASLVLRSRDLTSLLLPES